MCMYIILVRSGFNSNPDSNHLVIESMRCVCVCVCVYTPMCVSVSVCMCDRQADSVYESERESLLVREKVYVREKKCVLQ